MKFKMKNKQTKTHNSFKKLNRRPEKIFFQEDTKMTNRLMERCSASLIIREIQIKTTVK